MKLDIAKKSTNNFMLNYKESIGNITPVNMTNWEKLNTMSDNDIIHDNNSPQTTEADWDMAFICHSAEELQAKVTLKNTQKTAIKDKEQIAICFDSEILNYFRATGEGWQLRINDALKEWLKEHAI